MKDIYVTLQNSINNDGLWHPSISIFYSGCDNPNKCVECQNPELQQQRIGFKTNSKNLINDIEERLIEWLDVYKIMSICYLGGEPLAKWNRESTLEISKYFKQKYKDRICNVFYSWRYIEDIQNLKQYIRYMDYGVLGIFQVENINLDYIPSSTNQYIYDIKNNKKIETIKKG